MNKTRRAFGWSSLGIGAALAGSRGLALARSADARTIRLHEDLKLSCFEVNLARGRGADVFAAFGCAQPGAEAGDIRFTRSADGGVTWQTPTTLYSTNAPLDGTRGYQHAGLACLGDGLLLASTTKYGFLFGGKAGWRRGSRIDGVYMRASSDGGHIWAEARKIDTTPFRRAWTRGPIVEMQDGSLLLPMAGQNGSSYEDLRQPILSFTMRSTDRGENWTFHAIIAQGARDYDEPAMISLGGPRLLCVLRSHDAPQQDPPGGYLHMTISEDGGATWTKPQATSMWGHPANLLRLKNGGVLCTYGYRMHPNPGVRACLSEDGVNWRPGGIFNVNTLPDVDCDHLQIGCPGSVELDAGQILTAYQVWSQQRLSIEASLYRV
jgi:BNR repeat-like domain